MNISMWLLSGVVLVVAGCTPKQKSDRITISVVAPAFAAVKAEITILNAVNVADSTLAAVALDSAGVGTARFKLMRPTFGFLRLADRWISVYLEPGDSLVVRVGKTEATPTRYSGQGAEANNYISRTSLLRFSIEHPGRLNRSLRLPGSLAQLDSLKLALSDLQRHYRDSISLPDGLFTLLEKRNEVLLLSAIQRDGFNLKAATHAASIAPELSVIGKIPVDSTLLTLNLPEYIILHNLNMLLEYYYPLSDPLSPDGQRLSGSLDQESSEEKWAGFPSAVKKKIAGESHPAFLKELLYAKNVDYWMATVGLTPAVDSIYRQFNQDYPNSVYRHTLQIQFDQWMALSPGRPAPDFSGTTIDGKNVALSDLKGKAVYIDVWATWCGPCVEEIPFSKRLQKKFGPNDPIVFLNISVTDDQKAWKKKVLSDTDWKGMHIIEPSTNQPSALKTKYRIWGIPRFMLIDPAGNIASVDAPRPSSGQVIVEKIKAIMP